MDRHRDKLALVRSAWVSAAGRIITTAGGNKGLEAEQEATLLKHIADMLVDNDEKVRLAALQTIGQFDFKTIVQKLGSQGGVEVDGSMLRNLVDRAVDPKALVHTAAIELLGRIWGVAAGAIAEGDEAVRAVAGSFPSHILEARYKNIGSINAVVPKVLYESLLPVGFPSVKSRANTAASPSKEAEADRSPDEIRVERMLILVRDLDVKAQKVFFAAPLQAAARANYLNSILGHCEAMTKGSKSSISESKAQIAKLVEALVKDSIDPKTAADHLEKFFNHADRRNFALARFCYSAESDYKRVANAIREIKKRLEQAPSDIAATSSTVVTFLHSASLLIYNKSHVPAIMEFARTDKNGLGSAATSMLQEIAEKCPMVFKVHSKELCETLKQQAPTATTPNDPSAVDSLKACAAFSRRYPKQIGGDRDFYKAMAKMAMHGSPPTAAKHSISIIVTSADKKEMYIKDIMKYCIKNFDYGAESFLSRLAAMSQLRLLANAETEDDEEKVTEIAVEKLLAQSRTPATDSDPEWSAELNDDLTAKLLALRLVVNGFRGKAQRLEEDVTAKSTLEAASIPIFRLLNTLIEQGGELSQDSATPTPSHHKSRLRLAAAKLILRLCCSKACDALFLPADFNRLVKIVQDPVAQVRAGFNQALKKYLGQGRLRARFYGLVFVYAFEPDKRAKEDTETWLRARAMAYAQRREGILEAVFPRFLSLLAHHDDFGPETEDLEDFVEYIMFYLKNVATEVNLPHIYKFAQAIKGMGVQDRIDPSKSNNLYILADLSEAMIRHYHEIRGWSLTVLAGKPQLPSALFARVSSATAAQEISEKRYLPEDLVDKLEDIVKSSMRSRKRKSDGTAYRPSKKPKQAVPSQKATPAKKSAKSAKKTKTPRRAANDSIPPSERRKSERSRNSRSYAENDDSEDDEELEQWQAVEDDNEEEDSDEDDNNEEEAADEDEADDDAGDAESPEPAPPRNSRAEKADRIPPKKANKATGQASSRSTRSRVVAQQAASQSDSDELSNPPSDMEM